MSSVRPVRTAFVLTNAAELTRKFAAEGHGISLEVSPAISCYQ
jgi:hypothetical protein